MSKARRRPAGQSAAEKASAWRTSSETRAEASADPVARILPAIVLALIVVRWLVPAESAPDGDTLWIVQLWLAAGLVWAWGCLRSRRFMVRLGAFDAALWTLVLAHVLSTAAVFVQGGDRRAALNMAWEWVGLGATFFLLRQTVPGVLRQVMSRGEASEAGGTGADPDSGMVRIAETTSGIPRTGDAPADASGAARLALVTATLGIVFAGLGIWQHYIYYPRAAAEYRRLLTELDALRAEPAANSRRIGQLELTLEAQGVPSDEAGRRQFENRLRFSNEPFGPFALANTFAGFLVVALLLAGDLFRGAWNGSSTRPQKRRLSNASLAAWGLAFLLLVYCLVLTKSRTAWIALLAGLAFWGACHVGHIWGRVSRRTALIAAAVAAGIAAVLVVLFVVAALGGGFDVQVISEAPKSLEYRLQYWRGAAGVLREHPFFGTGPGNFRQHYLRYKVPESSEEIADPHNLLFDLWTSGGALAVAAFFACVVLIVVPFLRRRTPSAQRAVQETGEERIAGLSGTAALIGGIGGFLLAIPAPALSGAGDLDPWALLLLVGWLIAFMLLGGTRGLPALSAAGLGAAALALCVHLLDLGGIEMPAVVQLFLVISVMGFAMLPARAVRESRPTVLAAGAISVLLFVGCLMSATLPVLNRRAALLAGEQALVADRVTQRAIEDFRLAADRDPLSPDPPQRLAEAYFARWQSPRSAAGAGSGTFVPPGAQLRGGSTAEEDFALAQEALDKGTRLDPFNPRLPRRRGEMLLAKFARDGQRADAEAASAAFVKAIERYPNDSSLRALQATALSDAGRPDLARSEAQRALALDEINRQWGHTDRYLSDNTVAQLRRLAGGPGPQGLGTRGQ